MTKNQAFTILQRYGGIRAARIITENTKKLSKIKGIEINTSPNSCIPGIVNFSVIGYNVEVFIRALSLKGIYVSSRSVCSVEQKDQVSSTLFAMKKDINICTSSIRVSFDKELTTDEIDYFVESVKEHSAKRIDKIVDSVIDNILEE